MMYYKTSDNIASGIKRSFKEGSLLIKLIYINIALFLSIQILYVFTTLMNSGDQMINETIRYIGIPANFEMLITHPWSIITYMFTHVDIIHLLFNMVWLYWFGSLFLNYFSQKTLLLIYLLGGMCGGVLYQMAYNIFPLFEVDRDSSFAIGASGAIMAIVFTVCTYRPNYAIYIFLIGEVKLKYLAIFTAVIDLIAIPAGNAGGHITHLGGAALGVVAPFIINVINNRKEQKKGGGDKDLVNHILDKISRCGYSSLTKREKEILFKSSNRK